jgi:hypothetical protein
LLILLADHPSFARSSFALAGFADRAAPFTALYKPRLLKKPGATRIVANHVRPPGIHTSIRVFKRKTRLILKRVRRLTGRTKEEEGRKALLLNIY